MGHSRKYHFDLHVHTSRHSGCSSLSAEKLIAAALEQKLDGIVLTDHEYLWPEEELQALLHDAGNPALVLLSGAETLVSLDSGLLGDVLLYGCTSIPEAGTHLDDVCRHVHNQGGIVVAAHPFAPGRGIGEELFSARIDGIEVQNYRYYKREWWERAAKACEQLHLPATGGSDSHVLKTLGMCHTEFDAPIRSNAELISAIKGGHCSPFQKPDKLFFQTLFGFK